MTVLELMEQLGRRKPKANVILHLTHPDSEEEYVGEITDGVGNDMLNVVFLYGTLTIPDADEVEAEEETI
jgi:hypothetical protein